MKKVYTMNKINITLTIEADPAAPVSRRITVEGTGEPQDLGNLSEDDPYAKDYPHLLDSRQDMLRTDGTQITVKVMTDAAPGDRWLFNGYSTKARLEVNVGAGPMAWHFDSVAHIYSLARLLSEMIKNDRQPLVEAVI